MISQAAQSDSQIKDRVYFSPSLHNQRQAWILGTMRREHVTSVLDVGCNQGYLLSCLCNPSAYILSETALHPRTSSDPDSPRIDYTRIDTIPAIGLKHLAGLDIDKDVLVDAISTTTPPPENASTSSSTCDLPRWEPLEVDLWLGSLDVFNEAFVGAECIVASEVIEHLPAHTLENFAPTLLGVYRPRLLLVTTPNYTYNERFNPPGCDNSNRFPDPSGRTNRVFRHHDHQFEWTTEEFMDWCKDTAQKWGYEVDAQGIGKTVFPDPWGRDERLGYASLVACFKRKDTIPSDTQQKACKTALSKATARSHSTPHSLLVTHNFKPHPQTGLPKSPDEIIKEVITSTRGYFVDSGLKIWDLWVTKDIAIACGGFADVLVETLNSSTQFELIRTPDLEIFQWAVKYKGELHEAHDSYDSAVRRQKSLWEEHQRPDQDRDRDRENNSEDEADSGDSEGWWETCGHLVDDESVKSVSEPEKESDRQPAPAYASERQDKLEHDGWWSSLEGWGQNEKSTSWGDEAFKMDDDSSSEIL